MNQDNNSNNKNLDKTDSQVDLGDWDPDRFPTSPKVVFKRSLLLFFFLGALCFSVYQCSEHEEPSKNSIKSDNTSLNSTNELENSPFGDGEDEVR